MGQQMHPGVAGQGGPQVSQAGAMMPGMIQGGGPPGVSGGGPSAHAMSHLNPNQGPMFAHPQQQMQPASKFYPFFCLCKLPLSTILSKLECHWVICNLHRLP